VYTKFPNFIQYQIKFYDLLMNDQVSETFYFIKGHEK
jgi:hypothetical protein